MMKREQLDTHHLKEARRRVGGGLTFELTSVRVCIELERVSRATASVTNSTKESGEGEEDRKAGKKERSHVKIYGGKITNEKDCTTGRQSS